MVWGGLSSAFPLPDGRLLWWVLGLLFANRSCLLCPQQPVALFPGFVGR
jgi:hypothetical protein